MALKDNIVAYWKLDGNSNDSVGTHTGTDTSITYNLSNGKIAQGAGFGGSSKILFTDSSDWDFGSGDFACSMWIKRSLSGTVERFFGQEDSGGLTANSGLTLVFNVDNTVMARARYGTSTVDAASVSTIANTNWHHIVVTRVGNTMTLYIDGSSAGTGNMTGVTINNSTSTLGLGQWGDFASNPFTGSIDEVGIWKGKGLSQEEVTQLYNNGLGKTYPFASGFFF